MFLPPSASDRVERASMEPRFMNEIDVIPIHTDDVVYA
jgi:hypothetical protein